MSAYCRARRASAEASGPAATLCTLPDDIMNIIFDTLNFGGNKEDIWAVAGTCKALRAFLARYSPEIKLNLGKSADYVKDGWKPKQIAGMHSIAESSDDYRLE